MLEELQSHIAKKHIQKSGKNLWPFSQSTPLLTPNNTMNLSTLSDSTSSFFLSLPLFLSLPPTPVSHIANALAFYFRKKQFG